MGILQRLRNHLVARRHLKLARRRSISGVKTTKGDVGGTAASLVSAVEDGDGIIVCAEGVVVAVADNETVVLGLYVEDSR